MGCCGGSHVSLGSTKRRSPSSAMARPATIVATSATEEAIYLKLYAGRRFTRRQLTSTRVELTFYP